MNKIEKLLLVHGSDLIFVGIDVAKKSHYARIIDHIGRLKGAYIRLHSYLEK